MRFNTAKLRTFAIAVVACMAFSACSDDTEEEDISYNVPGTYDFENVNYEGQTTRLAMLSELDAYIKTGNTGNELSAQKMKNMYANAESPFSDPALNEATTKQLKNKTILTAQPVFESLFDALATASQNGSATASEGMAGILTTGEGRTYLVDANGVEYGQLIQKGLMGAVFYNQAVDGYLTEEKIGAAVDNTSVTKGEGTVMEHHWDEAFGYFGAPKDFPANVSDARFWANYSNQVDAALGSNKAIMDAFIKGRAAISAKDMQGKEAAAETIRTEWERLVAAATIHELNAAKNNLADQAKKSHYLSEALGFVMGLQYKTGTKFPEAKVQEVMNTIGTNLYQTTGDDIAAAIDIISTAYDMNSIKGQL